MRTSNLFSISRRHVTLLACTAALALATSGCAGSSSPPEPEVDGGGEPDVVSPEPALPALETMAKSTRNDVKWKRARALENGIGQSLLLDEGEVCKEFGRYSCVDKVHLVALGGNDPYDQGLYEPPQAPGATTAVAVERLLWAACQRAVDKERTTTPQLIFLDLNLDVAALDLTVASQRNAVEDSIVNLYRRFHARDPLPAELSIAKELVVDAAGAPVSAELFATMACFSIGSTSETIFY